MLPTTGFFKDIDCPYYEKSCARPYCHFRHRKRSQEPPEESPPLPPDEPLEIPTYKPTPKSELANTKSHIPISYVPDLIIRSDRNLRPIPPFNLADRPTYKPTPISILSSTNVSKVCEYTPTSVLLDDCKEDINLDDLTTEFDLIDEILEDNNSKKEKYDKKDISKSSQKDKKTEREKSKSKDSDKGKDKHRKDKYGGSSSKNKHKERDKDLESEEIKHKDNKSRDKSKDKGNEETKNKEDKYKDKEKSKEKEEIKHKDKEKIKEKEEIKHKEKDEIKQKEREHESKSKDSKRDKDKNKEKGRDNDKEKPRERDKEKEVSNNNREKEKRDKEQNSSEKHKNKDRREKDQVHNDSKNKDCKEKEQSHIDNKSKSKGRKEKEQIINDRDKNKDRKEKSQSHSDKDRSKERDGYFDKDKNKDRHFTDREKTKDRDKVKHKDKDQNYKDKREKEKNRDKKSEKHGKSRKRDEPEKQESIVQYDPTDDFENEVNFMMDAEDDEMDSIEAECYKIFNEYTPPIIEEKYEPMPTENSDIVPEPYNPTCKKRIAYENANQSSSKIVYNKPKPITNMSVIMLNRLKQARQAQADNNHRDLLAELNKPNLKRGPEVEFSMNKKFASGVTLNGKPKPSVPSLSKPSQPVSLVDEILSGKNTNKPRRIAPVQNVNLIQRAKAQFDAMVKNKAAQVLKTQAQTLSKGNKRVAHIPDASLSDIPDVLQAERSKLPVNVRTRYLTMLADECIKLYLFKEDAYQRALNEELKCYEKCSVLTTYRNSAMLAINRLRKEIQERERDGLGPIQPGEDGNRVEDSPLQGKRFYESIQNYVLTEDELVLHGYPREGPEPGRAIITSDSRVVSDNLDEHQRICCRCHKLYIVDDDGLPLVNEDCVYHPLRKRTLRGERTYLCCKSIDDVGCVVSSTHVSEVSADRELEGYQSTLEPEYEEDPRNYAVYALDCEMCYTTIGLELTRVTIVDTNLKTVYESLVKPLNPIIDYNTRFSGITKDQMDRTSTSILQVQANILHLCNSKTILIGHSLESDMKALKIIHSNVIDTSVMFPHKFGLPHKRALRVLASEYLKKIIQNSTDGHDSAEDALACMELVLWKVKEDHKVKGVKG